MLTGQHFKRPRPMKPEKLLELMRKLRKGFMQGIKGFELDDVLTALPGWKVEDVTEVKATGPSSELNYGDRTTMERFKAAKAHEVMRRKLKKLEEEEGQDNE